MERAVSFTFNKTLKIEVRERALFLLISLSLSLSSVERWVSLSSSLFWFNSHLLFSLPFPFLFFNFSSFFFLWFPFFSILYFQSIPRLVLEKIGGRKWKRENPFCHYDFWVSNPGKRSSSKFWFLLSVLFFPAISHQPNAPVVLPNFTRIVVLSSFFFDSISSCFSLSITFVFLLLSLVINPFPFGSRENRGRKGKQENPSFQFWFMRFQSSKVKLE